MKDNFIEWTYEFDGKRYGSAIGKGQTDGISNKTLMHQYIDMIARQMHETLDKVAEAGK